MKLILRNIRHTWARTLLQMLSITIAFTLFGVLMAFEGAYTAGGDAGQERMITVSRISFTQPLPMAHFQNVQALNVVGSASFAAWFGGYHQEPRNSLHAIAVEPRSYLAVYGDDIQLSEDERATFLQERSSIVVGTAMAKRFGWKAGDQIPILTRAVSRRDGSRSWTFRIAGIFKGGTPQVDTNFLYIHYDYFNEARAQGRDTIGWIITVPAPGIDAPALGQAIDRLFDASPERTTTDTERSFNRAFAAQFGDLALAMLLVLGGVLFSILLIVASTTMLTIRGRRREIGILKVLGYSHMRVFLMLVGESLLVALTAGTVGLAIASAVVYSAHESLAQIAPGMAMTLPIVLWGLACLIGLALSASAWPAWCAVNGGTAAALRRS